MRDYAAAAVIGLLAGTFLWLPYELFAIDGISDSAGPAQQFLRLSTIAVAGVAIACMFVFARNCILARAEQRYAEEELRRRKDICPPNAVRLRPAAADMRSHGAEAAATDQKPERELEAAHSDGP